MGWGGGRRIVAGGVYATDHPGVRSVVLLLLGAATSLAGKLTFDMNRVRGQEPAAAAAALLAEAEVQAGAGTWERIAIGDVYYRTGDRERAQKYFDAVLGATPEASDFFRVAIVYADGGEWDKAKPLFEKGFALKPKDHRGAADAAGRFTSLVKQRREVLPQPDRLESLSIEQAGTHLELIASTKNRENSGEILHLPIPYKKTHGPQPQCQTAHG